jgi:hypothetical protein
MSIMAQQPGTTLHKGNTISKPLRKAEYLGEARHVKAKIVLTLSKHATREEERCRMV